MQIEISKQSRKYQDVKKISEKLTDLVMGDVLIPQICVQLYMVIIKNMVTYFFKKYTKKTYTCMKKKYINE